MKSILLRLPAVVVAGLGMAAARADISATEHTGHGITPADAPGIRMVSAKVDIDWGEPGKLRAVFVMNNEATTPTNVQLGFPVSLPEQYRDKHGLGFTMSFDGVPIDPGDIRQDVPAKDDYSIPRDTIWFHCQHRFPPGETKVEVETKLPPTAAYRHPYMDYFEYCVQTGAGWKGTIGLEEIAIHFPAPIERGQILNFAPNTGKVEGNTVRWRFQDFEPQKGDHDVILYFVEPGVFPVLADLRRQAAAEPDNARKQLDLIKHLLGLSNAWLTYPMPPERMTRKQYQDAVGMLRSNVDRRRFRSFFHRGLDGRYERGDSSPDWTYEERLTSMFNAVGYVKPWARSIFLREGRALIAKYLKQHPHDAEAWLINVEHRVGTYLPSIAPFELDLTAEALHHCPDDSAIRLWNEIAQLVLHQPRDIDDAASRAYDEQRRAKLDELNNELKKRGIFELKYSRQVSQDYY